MSDLSILIMIIDSLTLIIFFYCFINSLQEQVVNPSQLCMYLQRTERLKELRNQCFKELKFCYEDYVDVNSTNVKKSNLSPDDRAYYTLPPSDLYLQDPKVPSKVKNYFKQIDRDVLNGRLDREDARTIKRSYLEDDPKLREILQCPSEPPKYRKDIYKGEIYTVETHLSCCTNYISSIQMTKNFIQSITTKNPKYYVITFCTYYLCDYVSEDLIYKPLFSNNNNKIKSFNESIKDTIKNEVFRMFNKSMTYYLLCGFPYNELKPLTCSANVFDVVPKTSLLTLVDSLDTMILFKQYDMFRKAVKQVCKISFDIDQNVSLFETTIRVLGGLLSAHTYAINTSISHYDNYNGCLLKLAIDLADRLTYAFDTDTEIPYGTVNLKYGVPYGETTIASLAGAGSLYLEFGYLSSLTHNLTYLHRSRRALISLINRRSDDDLYGKHINTSNGEWTEKTNGLGSNSDSFFEYLYKGYVLFNDKELYKAFVQAVSSMSYYNIYFNWLVENDISSPLNSIQLGVDALVTFFPGLLAQNGYLNLATSTMIPILNVWDRIDYFPEMYSIDTRRPAMNSGNSRYLLRPETIESLVHIYKATKDENWLFAGLKILENIRKLEVKFGFSSVENIITGELLDEMPSFFLSETLKYLYLLFDDDENIVFKLPSVLTTEGHPFLIKLAQTSDIDDYLKRQEELFPENEFDCIFDPKLLPLKYECKNESPFFYKTYRHHMSDDGEEEDNDDEDDEDYDSSNSSGKKKEKTVLPNKTQHFDIPELGSFNVTNVVDGFNVTHVNSSESILMNSLVGDVMVITHNMQNKTPTNYIYSDGKLKNCVIYSVLFPLNMYCSPATFAVTNFTLKSIVYIPPPDIKEENDEKDSNETITNSITTTTTDGNNNDKSEGCKSLMSYTSIIKGKIIYLDRGGCSFSLKAKNAEDAGAVGLIVGNLETDHVFTMSSTPINNITVYSNIPVVMIRKTDANLMKSFITQNPYTPCNILLKSDVVKKSRITISKQMFATFINCINFRILLTQIPGTGMAQLAILPPENTTVTNKNNSTATKGKK